MIQLVVWTQLRFVERVARLTGFFGIIIPVRRRNLEPAFLLIDELLQVGRFAFCICDCRRREIGKKLVYCRNIVCCLVFELICGPILVPKQLRFLCSKLSGANHDAAGVEVPAMTIAPEGSLHDPFAQWSILQRAEWRLSCGVLKLNDELAFLV